MNKNIAQTLIGVALGGFFLFLTLKNKPLTEIAESIKQANLWWIALSGVALIAVFLLRAMRWRLLISNVGYQPKKRHVAYALTMGYFINSFTPKVGEIVRCTTLHKKDDVPISHSLGTVVSERVYDLIILGLGLIVIFAIEINRLGHLLDSLMVSISNLFSTNTLLAVAGALVIAGVGYAIFRYLLKKGLFNRVTGFLSDMMKTVRATFRIKNYKGFVILTILIWIALVVMNYCFLMCLPETSQHNFYFAAVVLFVGSIGWALPSPGGIGTTHFFILQLFLAFNLTESAGIAFGVLSNGLTFIYTIIFGVLALILNTFKAF